MTGATGKLGRATLQYLVARGAAAETVRPIVRDLAKAHDLVDRKFDVAYGSYTDAALLEAAFSGVGKLLFISTSALGEERMLHHRSEGHVNRAYPITVSRECYGLPEIAAELGNATGRTIQFQPVTTDEFRTVLERASLPPPAVAMSVALGEAVRAGEFDLSHPVFEQLLGRAPISLSDFLPKTLKP